MTFHFLWLFPFAYQYYANTNLWHCAAPKFRYYWSATQKDRGKLYKIPRDDNLIGSVWISINPSTRQLWREMGLCSQICYQGCISVDRCVAGSPERWGLSTNDWNPKGNGVIQTGFVCLTRIVLLGKGPQAPFQQNQETCLVLCQLSHRALTCCLSNALVVTLHPFPGSAAINYREGMTNGEQRPHEGKE